MHRSFSYINQVPQSKDLIDICLSKTNRKTPTVIHPSYEINRIRNFYIRKVRHAADEFTSKISTIVGDFPVMEEIHPFYADLISILYDRDSYKIALGHLNSTKNRINSIMASSLKLIKFGDSLYRCKCLKRASLGQMATAVMKIKDSLSYLESVRQHLSRLPSIDPTSRTIIVAGFPNVGKSSFINSITNCKTEVQPYAFTTKSLFVGHFEFNHLKYQIIDTPGILDHSLDERNQVEMLSITALAHLKSSVMYFIDLSESCGYSIEDQISLFKNISPLLNSQILIVLSKSDLYIEMFSNDNSTDIINTTDIINNTDIINTLQKKLVKDFLKDKSFINLSSTKNINIQKAKQMVCEMLLDDRIDSKKDKIDHFTNRIRIVEPEKFNPKFEESYLGKNRFHSIEDEHERETYFSKDKYDVIPEIYNGKNISDFIHMHFNNDINNSINKDINYIINNDMNNDMNNSINNDMNNINLGIYQKLSNIHVNPLRTFDILDQSQRDLYEEVNNARVSATMMSIFNKRSTAPVKHVTVDPSMNNKAEMIRPNKLSANFNKKARSGIKNFHDKAPKHAFREVSRKHGRTI